MRLLRFCKLHNHRQPQVTINLPNKLKEWITLMMKYASADKKTEMQTKAGSATAQNLKQIMQEPL